VANSISLPLKQVL